MELQFQPRPAAYSLTNTIGFSRMESQLLPRITELESRKTPSASAAWSLNFYLDRRRSSGKTPSALAAWSSQLQPRSPPLKWQDAIGFSRMELQLLPRAADVRLSRDTIGFSRMELQFQPRPAAYSLTNTIGFSRMEQSTST